MERPIILKAHEVRGILDGRQTQLRRIIKPPRWSLPEDLYVFERAGSDGQKCVTVPDDDGADFFVECPFGQVGDRLWGRECFSGPYSWHECPPSLWVGGEHSLVPPLWYWADGNPDDGDWTKPKPSTQMPRHFSRILLEIVSLRVERLQDISDPDLGCEGIDINYINPCGRLGSKYGSAVRYYAKQWIRDNGKGSWDANPWVWVVEFKRVEA